MHPDTASIVWRMVLDKDTIDPYSPDREEIVEYCKVNNIQISESELEVIVAHFGS